MRLATLLLVAGLTLAACKDSTAPTPDLTGTWAGSSSGMGFTFILIEEGQQLRGNGFLSIGGNSLNVTVAGSHRHPTVAFSIVAQGFESAGYSGKVVSASRMEGLLAGSGFTGDSLVLFRQ
jgi:hypothetical protein